MVPEPVSTAATVVSVANGLRSLLGGGGSKQSSVHQGWRVQGTLTRDGLTGSNTAFDQLGNTWGGAIEAGSYYAPIFRDYLGDSTDAFPVDLTVSAGEGYNAGVVRQLREAFETAWGSVKATPTATAAPPIVQAPSTPVSLFDPDPTADQPQPTMIYYPARPATGGNLFSWLGDLLGQPPATPTSGSPPTIMQTIIPQGLQSNATKAAGPTATAQPGAMMALGGVLPMLVLGAVALYALKGS